MIDQKKKLACFTLDLEEDYGDRTGCFNTRFQTQKLIRFRSLLKEIEIPLSIFIQTNLIEAYPETPELLSFIGSDFHCHSHSHNTKLGSQEHEIYESANVFRKYFGEDPLGYRAPQGVLGKYDFQYIASAGFKFSSSVFPSFRPGKFNNLTSPIEPYLYDNQLIEFPFAVAGKTRVILSLSYIKLLGKSFFQTLFNKFELPQTLVIDCHLHDLINPELSIEKLPLLLRRIWSIRKDQSYLLLEWLLGELKQRGYQFITMSELYNEHHGKARPF